VTGAPALTEVAVGADPAAWETAGFTVEEGVATVGTVRITFAPEGRRIIGWALHGLGDGIDLDGLPTEPASEPPAAAAPAHPNGIDRIDHVVAFTPDMDRTVATLKAAGLDLRRTREGPTSAGSRRQAFFRVGEPILETIEHPPHADVAADLGAPARFWGLAFSSADLGATAKALGPLAGEPKDAIQEGRRIVTVRREAGLGLPVAIMSR
jgi:catechol 2,3-dioxygenase-like lactoylglutathione lyase family enzyme